MRKDGTPTTGPCSPFSSADCVNLGYVLNVIEDTQEREQTLRQHLILPGNSSGRFRSGRSVAQ